MSIKIEHKQEFIDGVLTSDVYYVEHNKSQWVIFSKEKFLELKAKLKDYEI